MGYDISTRLADRDKAAAFAKKYGYSYMFNEDSGEYQGDEAPYFRANIWGMGTIRRALFNIYQGSQYKNEVNDGKLVEILDKFSWNDGAHVTVKDCEFLIRLWDKDKAIDSVMLEVHDEIEADKNYLKSHKYDEEKKEFVPYTATVDEVVNGKVALLEEFVDYLGVAKELDGCLVW